MAETEITVSESVTFPAVPFDLNENDMDRRFEKPFARPPAPPAGAPAEASSDVHLLGTDENGRDMLCRLLWGARVSLAVGFVAVGIYVLLGVAAFSLSLWWTMRKAREGEPRPSGRMIWERFPKFVLGFLATSLLFSFLVDPGVVKDTKAPLGGLRTAWFALAFTSIGLETRFGSLLKMDGGRPALAFVAAQVVNLIWTLLIFQLWHDALTRTTTCEATSGANGTALSSTPSRVS